MTPWTVACQSPLSMGFSKQKYWSGLPCHPPGDLHDPGIEHMSPELQADSLLLSTVICQCTLISCSKCTPVVGGIVGAEHCVCVGMGACGNSMYFPLNFAMNVNFL